MLAARRLHLYAHWWKPVASCLQSRHCACIRPPLAAPPASSDTGAMPTPHLTILPPHASETYTLRLSLLGPACLVAGAWLFRCRGLRPGKTRLLAVLPVLALFFYAPLLFNRIGVTQEPDIITIVLVEFALTWLASYKVRSASAQLRHPPATIAACSCSLQCIKICPLRQLLSPCVVAAQALAWACGRGPLVQPWSLLQFCAVLLAPMTPVASGKQGLAPGPAGYAPLFSVCQAASTTPQGCRTDNLPPGQLADRQNADLLTEHGLMFGLPTSGFPLCLRQALASPSQLCSRRCSRRCRQDCPSPAPPRPPGRACWRRGRDGGRVCCQGCSAGHGRCCDSHHTAAPAGGRPALQ